jgi:predicted RNase H-like HicB family nuclease
VPGDDVELALTDAGAPAVDRTILIFLYFVHMERKDSYIPVRRLFMGKRYIYRVIIEPDEDRFHAEIPALPGCYSWGYTYEEALRNIKEAAELWIETLAEDGETIPEEDPKVLKEAPITLGVVL